MTQAKRRSNTPKAKDPIFALIEAQKAAERAHHAACMAYTFRQARRGAAIHFRISSPAFSAGAAGAQGP